ncbi:D-alanine--D-alanine ligase [Romboutsia lituseburensis]|uniref:D-alanine--D-alanine ligase n=1 Tax=Romboutsia lituseburensis DSM 797 TaxID=1121325 RepID=A0A1G9L6Q3_9FIRM|nr:D-alanine--D-alanine ligase [Romboutsia lituseburensis]CEH35192.1 D-alanine--D-alanine ligase [Romboutsia lituseburensis]SDL57640.1 D-alanine-D-alanine ligase [Romboutsia lituseburensis DSM 797]
MKIAVIMGGISSEREVSLNSGLGVYNNLDKNKYEVVKIILDDKMDIFTKLSSDIDFAFLALHGKFGEDGCIQSILETMDIPYSGCGPLTSALCMDKNMTKKILRDSNLPTAPWLLVKSIEEINYDKIDEIGYPVFIKPNCGGSSVATFFIHSKDEVLNAVKCGLEVDTSVMIEKYIPGGEYTSFVLNGEVFPTLSIKSNSEFFDYESKYSANGAIEEVVYLEEDLQNKINAISKTCWDVFNCKAYVRVDIIISNGVPYVLELNTLPGMTQTSLIPQSAKAKGIEFSELLDKIIEYSLN